MQNSTLSKKEKEKEICEHLFEKYLCQRLQSDGSWGSRSGLCPQMERFMLNRHDEAGVLHLNYNKPREMGIKS